jgi:hypothetical protein
MQYKSYLLHAVSKFMSVSVVNIMMNALATMD